MRVFTIALNKGFLSLFLFAILLLSHASQVMAQVAEPVPTIYWVGSSSTDWGLSSNWSPARIPGSSDVVAIGTTHFTGSNHPTMNETAVVTVKSLILSNESNKGTKLLITNNYNLVVTDQLIIKSGATLENEGSDMVLQGSFINDGSYIETEFLKNNGRKGRFYPSIEMSGVKTATSTPTIGGNVPLTISHLKITGYITLAQDLIIRTRNITVSGQNTKPTSDLTIVGTFDPATKKVTFVGKGASDTTPDDATNTFVLEAGGTQRVMAATYAQNYSIQPTTMYTTSIVEYGSATLDQDIFARAYGILKISGKERTKKLIGATTVSNIDAATQLIVESGTLDLQTFSLNRTGGTNVIGGTITVANDAFLKIGGTGTFPTGYQVVSLGPISTVEYYGENYSATPALNLPQPIAAQTYGNLRLSGSGTKSMPGTIFTVAGDFSSGGTVSYTAGNNFTVLGDVSIGAGTIFDGSNRALTVGGNWTNNGTFIPTTSTVILNGAGKQILRTTGTVPFHHLSVTTGQITAGVNVELFGNLTTSGGGKFTSTADFTMSSATAMSITGESITLNNLIGNGITNTIATIAVNGNLTVNPGKSFIATGGVINMQGANKAITNNGSLQFYSLRALNTITTASNFSVLNNLSGTGQLTATNGTITFNGTSSNGSTSTFGGTHNLHNVSVNNGQVLTLNSNSNLGISNVLATTGTINVNVNTPNTITFNRDGVQDVPGRQYFNLVLANNGIKTALGSLTVAGDMTVRDIPTATTGFAAGSFVHTIESNLYNNAGTAFNAGASTISFTGSGNSSVTGSNTVFNVLQVNKLVNSSYLQLNNNIQTKDLIVGTTNSAAGEIRTGSFVLTVTGDRTGLGWVYGTIKRERTSFVSNEAYAFAGPYNTIKFTDALGITAVTVTNTSGIVSNFTNGNAINRRYEVSVTGGNNHAGIMRLQYNDGVELNGNTEAAVQFFKETSTGDSWEAKGVTNRSVTENWVEYATLADVKGRWTLSESSGILQWTGTQGTDWHTPGNWNGNTVPLAGDIVQFGGDGVINQPTLTGTTTVKAIQFLNNGKDMTLTLGANANLTVNGNVAANGSGASAKAHEVKVDNATALLTVGGSLVLSGGLTNNLKLTINAGNVSVAGDINQSNLSSIALNAGTLNIGGDYNGAGLTAATGSTVNYNGTGSQIIAPVNYHNLIVSKISGIATLTSTAALTIGGELSKTGNGSLALRTDDLTINGNVTMAAGNLDAGNSTIKVGGNWTRTSGTFLPATSIVTFTGNTNTTIGVSGGNELAYNFNKLVIDKGVTSVFTANSNININADFEIVSGIVNLGLKTITRTAPGGNFRMSDASKLLLENSNFPANFLNVELSNNSTVVYQGTIEQLVAPVTYGNLSFANGNAESKVKKLQAATTINGTLGIAGNATLHGEGQTITLKGTFSLATGGKFIAGATYSEGTLVLSPILPGKKTPFYLSGAITVNNLLLEPFSDYTLSNLATTNSLTIKGNFNNNLGSINGTTLRVTFDGDFINTGDLISSGVAAFTGTREQTIQLRAPITPAGINPLNQKPAPPEVEFNGTVPPILNSTTPPQFGTVKIYNTGGVTTSVNWQIGGVLYVYPNAKFHGGSYTHTFATGIVNDGLITSTGTMHLSPIDQGIVSLLDTKPYYPFKLGTSPSAFQSTGTLRIGGTEMLALLGFVPGVLNNVIIDNTNATGIVGTSIDDALKLTLHGTWNIKGNLTVAQNSTFYSGTAVKYRLRTSATDTTTIPMAAGYYTIGGNLTNNGTINGGNGAFVLTNAIGQANSPKTPAILSGIGTTTLGNLTIETGSGIVLDKKITINGDFIYEGADFNSSSGIVRFAGTGNSLIKAPTAGAISITDLIVEKGTAASLKLEANLNDVSSIQVLTGTMDMASYEVVKPAVLAGDVSQAEITVADNAFLRIGGIGTTSKLQMDKYTFAENSTVEYYNPSLTPAEADRQIVLSEQYGNLKLSNLSTKEFAAGHAKIAGELIIGAEAKVVTPETIEYNGSGPQTVAAINYRNLTLSNAAIKTFAVGTVGVSEGLTTAGNATADADNTAVTVDYNGSASQNVLPTAYYNLTLSNTGIKYFSGTTGIANIFTPGAGLADLSAAGNIINFNGSVAQSIPGLAYKNIQVSGAGDKTLQAAASASESVIMGTGIIKTDSHILTLGNTASLVGETNNSYIHGKVVTERTFGATSGNSVTSTQGVAPQGITATSSDFGNIGIQVSTTKDLGTVTVTRETGVPIISPTSTNQSIARNFTFSVSNVSANSDLDASVIFKYLDWELNGLQEPDLRLSSFEDGKWIKQSTAAPDAATNTIGASVKTLTRLTLGSIISPLPVELLSFTAKKNGNNAELKWATASEKNNAGFEVQVSKDGYSYERIGFVDSKVGSSAVKQEYSFTDTRNGKNGTLYYRLKQIDMDGVSKLYGPKAIDFGVIVAATPVQAYPNPFNDKLRLSLSSPAAGMATIKLYTATGKLLKTMPLQVQAGLNENPLPLAQAAYEPGLYLLVIELNGQQQTIKLMKE